MHAITSPPKRPSRCSAAFQSELLRGDGIDQRVEQVGSRSGLAFPRVYIYGDDSFFRVATEGNAEMMFLILYPEIGVSSKPPRPYFNVRETKPSHDVCDTPLALLSRCHGAWPVETGVGLPIAAIVIGRSRCDQQRQDQRDALEHSFPP